MRITIIICLVFLSTTIMSQSLVENLPIKSGKFAPSDESLKEFTYPEWFRDAKFGIWAVWGPQSVPRQGDWYARKMYINEEWDNVNKKSTGKPDHCYTYHLENYGHPSEFGFKDIIPLWKAEKFDPEKLMKIYKRAGAKYFSSIATHHDNFFLWDSQIHRWNAVDMGPKQDIVAAWQRAAKKEGLRFGLTEHLGASFFWYQTAHSADQSGSKVGIPYDANDPKYIDLYHTKALPGEMLWLTTNVEFQRHWFDCIKELVDLYHPDLLYSDSALPFDNVGRALVAHYYNIDPSQEVVYTCKENSNGRFVEDYELGVAPNIMKHPWQTDSSIGDWIYRDGQKYQSARDIIYTLIDIVSKNGNLLLNVTLTPEGEIDTEQLEILDKLGEWLDINGEAIYSSRPWSVFGEGPTMNITQEKGKFAGIKPILNYLPGDVRFTTNKSGNVIYIFLMSDPNGDISIESLSAKYKVKSIRTLGNNKKVKYTQEKSGVLKIRNPKFIENSPVTVLKVKI